jgi:hypothetical protein
MRHLALLIVLVVSESCEGAESVSDCSSVATDLAQAQPMLVADSVGAVQLGRIALTCKRADDSLTVIAFTRDSIGTVIDYGPKGSGVGGGAQVRVSKSGVVRVVLRYQ